jgi:signal transduction histidine kinase
MFGRIRQRLTLLYTILTALALASFALVFYFGLTSLLMREQEREVTTYAAAVSRGAGEIIRKSERKRTDSEAEKKIKPLGSEAAYSYFLLSRGGIVVLEKNTFPAARADCLKLAESAQLEARGILSVTSPEGSSRLLWTKATVYDEGRQMGSLFVAKELDSHDHFVKRLAQTLGAAALLFLLMSGGIGYFAAGRALVPIRRSFDTQRRFVADASHELRTPLSVIQASLDVVEKEEQDRLSPFSQQVIADLKQEVRRMGRLTGDLLTLARSDAEGMELRRESFDLQELVQRAQRTMQPQAEAQQVTLVLAPGESLPVLADQDRVFQLLLVLLDNAVKYTPSGGKVSLAATRPVGESGKVLITVADTGPGVPQADQEKIFERFYRLDQSRSREAGGAGLGLAIARAIAQAHGGSISVVAAPTGGSVFRVLLP